MEAKECEVEYVISSTKFIIFYMAQIGIVLIPWPLRCSTTIVNHLGSADPIIPCLLKLGLTALGTPLSLGLFRKNINFGMFFFNFL